MCSNWKYTETLGVQMSEEPLLTNISKVLSKLPSAGVSESSSLDLLDCLLIKGIIIDRENI